MNRTPFLCIWVGALILAASSCQQAPFITMVDSRSLTFSKDGGTQSFSFSTNRDWSISSTESWCSIVPSSGQGGEEIRATITVKPNETYDSRRCSITIKSGELSEMIVVNQDEGLGLFVSPTSFDLSSERQQIIVEVKKNVNYVVNINTFGRQWIQRESSKALESEKVVFSIYPNESYDSRNGEILFLQTDGTLVAKVQVKQAALDGLIVTTPNYRVSKDAQSLDVEIQSNVEYEVTSEEDWIRYVETKALTNKVLVFDIDANETTQFRSGKVKITKKEGELSDSLTILQQPLPKISLRDALNIRLFKATLVADIEVAGVISSTQKVGFYYSPDVTSLQELIETGIRVESGVQKTSADEGYFGKKLSDLKHNTTYYYVAYATVLGEDYYTDVKSFTTEDFQEKVDLGVSVYWRGWNVGATNPFEQGDYFAWGETSPKEEYSWETYVFRTAGNASNNLKLSKYNSESYHGVVDNKTRLDLEDDAAYVCLGEEWRTPTMEEWKELSHKCDVKSATINDVDGFLITSKNDNCIFICAVGIYQGSEFKFNKEDALYWSANIYNYYMGEAFGPNIRGWASSGPYRSWGYAVRPVSDK